MANDQPVDQGDLFTVNPIEEKIAQSEQRGQRVTPWVRATMHAWAARGVRMPTKDVPEWERKLYSDYGTLPTICDCARCGEPSLIFPPEEGSPRGYCICPRCSLPPEPHLQVVS